MIPEDLLYTEEHEWLRRHADDVMVVGITDFAQEQLGEVVYVDLPEIGTQIVAGGEFGSIESVKASSELYSPVSGKVLEINTNLQENPELVNQSPFDEGWMVKIAIEDHSEIHGLMDSEAYSYHVKRLEKDEDPLDLADEEESTED